MAPHRRVLAAVDVTPESRQVVESAAAIAGLFEADLHIVHVVEAAGLPYGGVMLADLHSHEMQQMRDHARAHVAELADEFHVAEDRRHVIAGRPITEIHRLADAQAADLVVIGSHGRHGIGLLLGSTANGVLHGATCDVLAVRIQEASA